MTNASKPTNTKQNEANLKRARPCPEFVVRKIRKKAAAVARKRKHEIAKSLNDIARKPLTPMNQENSRGVLNWFLVRSKMKSILSDVQSQLLLTQKLRSSKFSRSSSTTSLWSASKASCTNYGDVKGLNGCISSQGLYMDTEPTETCYKQTSQLERAVKSRMISTSLQRGHESVLESLLVSKEFTDLAIITSDGRVQCHKAVVNFRYPKLKQFLIGNNTLDLVEVSNLQIDDWLSNYVYASKIISLDESDKVESLLTKFYDYTPKPTETPPDTPHPVKVIPQTKPTRTSRRPKPADKSKNVTNELPDSRANDGGCLNSECKDVEIDNCPSTIKVEPKENPQTDITESRASGHVVEINAKVNSEMKHLNKASKTSKNPRKGKNKNTDKISPPPVQTLTSASPLFSFF